MHGDVTSDDDQQSIIERFGLRSRPVRLLFTGDIASEGVNLHQQCHLLVHYDLPWSLIRIEQRNGRIDGTGRTVPSVPCAHPHLRPAVAHDPATERPRTLDDPLVGEKLLRGRRRPTGSRGPRRR